jgi:N-acetylmuramic acid 6-phosphate etherase
MGSTRMKAGTAAKLVLNSISTATMVRLGLTYSNLMVGVNATNMKLRDRLVRMLVAATDMERAGCERALAEAGGDTRVALLSLLCEVPPPRAATALRESGGSVREALRLLTGADVGADTDLDGDLDAGFDADLDAGFDAGFDAGAAES